MSVDEQSSMMGQAVRSESSSMIDLLRDIRDDQIKGREEHKGHYQRLSNVISEQNSALNRLSTDVAGLSVRTATVELEQRKQADTLARMKEIQDGCAARITHADDSTEIRNIRNQLHKAIQRRMTPPHGVPYKGAEVQDAPKSWWATQPGKALLGAIAGLIVAITTAITTYFAMAPARAIPVAPIKPVPADTRHQELKDFADQNQSREDQNDIEEGVMGPQ